MVDITVEKFSDDSFKIIKPQPPIEQIITLDFIDQRRIEINRQIEALQKEFLDLDQYQKLGESVGVVKKADDTPSQADVQPAPEPN